MTEPTAREGEGAWTRLRRRKVVQWGIAYAAGAWTLLQVLEYFGETYAWPRAVRQIAGLALPLGLLFVLVVAWYHGDKGEQKISRPELAILATIVAFVGGTLWWYVSRIDESAWVVDTGVSETRHAAQADAASIAVLPLVDMSPGKDQEYFADGMSEELLNLLSQLPQLRVIARTSSFSFKGKEVDIAEIAHKLNVAHVLEGSVRKSGDTVRVTAQLIRASDSTHLWSQTYDRQLTDVFKVQDEIARAVVAALQVKLLPAQQVTNRRRTANSEAYDEYLLGNHFYNRGSHDGFRRAIAAYRRAVMLDPDFGGAYAALALAEFYDLDFVTTPAELETGRQRVLVAAEKALALAPDLAQAYSTRGILRATLSQDWTGAQLDVTRALAQGPGSVTVHRHYAVVAVALGRSREGIAAAARAVELDPVSPYAWNSLGLIYLLSSQYAQAREALNRALVLDPAFIFSNYNLACVELLEGRPAQALPLFRRVGGTPYGLAGVAMAEYSLGHARESRQALDELIERYANGAAYHVARAHAWRGEKEEAFRWLERAYLQHDTALYAIRPDPLLASLHKDARFAALLKTLGLPP